MPKQNTIYLAGSSTTEYNLLCSAVVRSLDDVKGKKIRTTGASGRWARAIGGTPVSMGAAEMVDGIGRGLVDCILGPLGWLRSYSLYDGVKSVIRYPMGHFRTAGFMVMNLESWRGLSMNERTAMVRGLPAAIAGITLVGYIEDDERTMQKAKESGIIFTPGGPAFDAALSKHLKAERKTITERARKRGVKDSDRIVAAHEKALDKWHKIIAKIGHDRAAYEKALWDEIYSKIDLSKL